MNLFSTSDIGTSQAVKHKSNATRYKEIRRSIKLGTRYDKCQEVIGIPVKGETIHFVTSGDWSTHDLILHLCKVCGPMKLSFATWSISEDPCRQLIRACEAGMITQIKAVFDWRIKIRCPNALQLAKMNMNTIGLFNCHAKASVLQNDSWNFAIIGSANYTNNPRVEAGTITDDEAIANWHRAWIEGILEKSGTFD